MAIRASGAYLLASTAVIGPVKVSVAHLMASIAVGGPIQVSGAYVVIAVGANSRQFIFEEPLESSSELYGVRQFEVGQIALKTPEYNPYRPAIPDELSEVGPAFYDWAQENQEILRQQHEMTQAGDTTLPYDLMMQAHSTQKFNLGALTRFYHETHGIIWARYVMFDKMAVSPFAQAPCGLLKVAEKLRWVVTNDLSKSDSSLVVGVSAAYVTPESKSFGWVITNGPNLQMMGTDDANPGKQGEAYAWAGVGKVSTQASGRVLARRVGGTNRNPAVGELLIDLESFSFEQISEFIVAATDELQKIVEKLTADVSDLQEAANLDEFIKKTNSAIKLLQSSLKTESDQRKAGDRQLNERIANLPFVKATQLAAAVTALSEGFQSADATLRQRIKLLEDRALPDFSGAISDLQTSVDTILTQLVDDKDRPKGKFPLVSGDVPPQLMYLDDGTLVYEETY